MTNLEKYHEAIVTKEIIVGEKIKTIVEKHIQLLHEENQTYYFDYKQAKFTIAFIETLCHHSTGKFAGKPFLLSLWQKAFLEVLFGFFNKKTKLRKYREAFLVIGRGNGKSTLAAAIGLKNLMFDGELKADVYSIATKREQARIVFEEAQRMVNQSPSLDRRLKVKKTEIVYDQNHSIFKPLASQSKSLDGLIPYVVILDEVGAMQDRNLYDIINTAMSKRLGSNSLILMITTAGFVREGLYDERYDYASNVLNGTITNETFLPWIYELDSFNEWLNFAALIKANPNLGISKDVEILRQEWETAKLQAQVRESFLAKHCNMQASNSVALFGAEVLQHKNNRVVDVVRYVYNKYCVVGVDLSQTMDLTAIIINVPQVNGDFFFLPLYFIPEDTARDKEISDHVPYKAWSQNKYITFTKGASIDKEELVRKLIYTLNKYKLTPFAVGYDRYYAQGFSKNLEYEGLNAKEVRQGTLTISPLMKQVIPLFYDDKIIYNNNPILKWNLHNVKGEIDAKENIMPVKISPRKRIDGVMGMLDSFAMFNEYEEEFKAYQKPPLNDEELKQALEEIAKNYPDD